MDVSEDIKATADKITGGFFAPLTVEHAFLAGAIERAILAERERCAQIAEQSQIAGDEAPTLTSYNLACEQIAKAIRS